MRMGNVYKELSVDREHGRVMNDFQDTPILKGCKKEEKHAKELSASQEETECVIQEYKQRKSLQEKGLIV